MTDTPTPYLVHRFELGQTYTSLNASWPLSDYDLKFNTTVAGHARVVGLELFTDSMGNETRLMKMRITYERADGTMKDGGTMTRPIESVPSRYAEAFIMNTIGDGWWWSADRTEESQRCPVFGDRKDTTRGFSANNRRQRVPYDGE